MGGVAVGVIYYQDDDATLYHGRWEDVLPGLERVDACIVDAPYSERTHSAKDNEQRRDRTVLYSASTGNPVTTKVGRPIAFPRWNNEQAAHAAAAMADAVQGWAISITDHILAPHWERGFAQSDRYVFAPLPFLSPGSRVRLAGDGPSSWTCWIVAARPRCKPYSNWGTLPGGYVFPPERMPVVGGKPLSLMRALVRDYSRPGDTVLDPCAGGGATGVAAVERGRRFIGVEMKEEHCEIAAKRLAAAHRRPQLPGLGGEQGELF